MIHVCVGEDIDAGRETERVKSPEAGAVVVFVGTIRSEGNRVKALSYEHYPGMTEKALKRIAEEARARFGIINLSIAHRSGVVPAGEEAVVVAVSSAHREAAFEGCSWIMDRIKESVPIWKEIINEEHDSRV